MSAPPRVPTSRVPAGPGKALVDLIDERAWAQTPIGPREGWPQSLRTALSICLESRFPILIWWGPELVMLYNDAYAPLIGAKHPQALGQRGAACFPEIWQIIGPMLAGVRERGEATWSDDQLLLLERSGFPEECYFTFSYSPVRDESGGIGGVFTAVAETTQHVIGERRLRILREVAAATANARSPAEACASSAGALRDSVSVAFSLTYLFDEEAGVARLMARSDVAGRDAGPRPVPLVPRSEGPGPDAPWRLAEIAAGAETVLLADLAGLPARRAVVLPLAHGTADPFGAVVLGLNERRPLDDAYHDFLKLVARQIAAAVSDARAHEEERHRAEALAELDRAKTLFFTNVSHELRTPLTLILSPLEDLLAQPDAVGEDELRLQLDVVRRNALRLLRLVNTLLDFSRAESGRIDALFQPTDLAAVTVDLASSFRSAVEAAGLRLVVDCPPLAAPVFVDRDAWEKIVLNLLSNALKFTFDGEISIALEHSGAHVTLRVRDTGVGIPSDELPHLFERFHRIRDAEARSHEGSGIGLALVEELAKLHGGRVHVESAVGAGSTFSVELRTGSEHLPAEQLGGAEGTAARGLGAAPYVEEALRWLPDGGGIDGVDLVSLRDDVVRDAGGAPTTGGRILIADDNADMRAYLARLLRRHWQVEIVGDGEEALAAARAQPPDLVLSDVMMPRLDGFALLRELRADAATAGIPVVLVSARAGAESAVEGLEAGADDYLVKPFSARELIARVRANLELSRLRVDLAQLEAVAEERARAERVLMSLPDGVFTTTAAGAVDLWNPAASQLTGLARDAVVGTAVDEVLPGWADVRAHLAARRGRATVHPLELGGRELWVSVVAAPYGEGTLYTLRDATETARLEGMRRDLVTTVSHELRTPVSSIYGAAATLARTDLDLPAETRDSLTRILHDETERLSKIVGDLVTVSALDSGAGAPAREPSDADAVARRCLERAAAHCPPNVVLRGRLADRRCPLALEAVALEQILDALLDNAIRYSPEGGEVELAVELRERSVVFAVRDTGPGIPAEHRPYIGEKFYRVDPEQLTGVRGLGLSLYICRQLLSLAGGALTFDSADGAGSTFSVEVPRL